MNSASYDVDIAKKRVITVINVCIGKNKDTVVGQIPASPNHVQKRFFAKEPYVLGPDGSS